MTKLSFENIIKTFPLLLIFLGFVLIIWGSISLVTQNENQQQESTQKILTQDENVPESETKAENPIGVIIDEGGLSTSKEEELNNIDNNEIPKELNANQKSQITSDMIVNSGIWIATDYNFQDISPGSYEVKLGDTLWEISEAVYGDGFMWTNILSANSDLIDFLPNGSQALIFPGQILNIPIV